MGLGLGLGLNKPKGLIYFQNQFSMEFDGVDDRIITDGADTVLQNTTYSFWCKASTTGSNNGVFGHGLHYEGAFHFNYDGTRPLLYTGASNYVFWNDTSAQDDGEWHHWVVYSDANDISNSKLYVDGVLQTTYQVVSGATTAYTESLTIGSDRQVGGNSFAGKIDEFAVFDRELTQAEITRMFNTYYTNNLIQNSDFSEIGDEEVTNGDFSQIGNEEITNGNFNQQSAELVTNGDFSSESNWTGINNNGYSVSNGLLHLDNTTQFTTVSQSNVTDGSGVYKVQFTISNYVKGSVKIALGSNGVTVSEDGPQTVYLTPANGAGLIISGLGASGTTLDIDNVSVREVGQGWSFGTGWVMEDSKATHEGGSSNAYLNQQNATTVGKVYKTVFTLSGDLNATNYIQVYGVNSYGGFSNQYTSAGTYTLYFTADATFFRFRAVSPDNDISVENVSVKEVGQGFTFGDGWGMGDGIATCDGTQSSNSTLETTVGISGITNKQVKFSFDITDYQAGTLSATLQGTGGNEFAGLNSNGTYTAYISSADTTPKIIFTADSSFVGSIDNITIKEVGQHWTFGTGWSTDGTKAICAGDSSHTSLTTNYNFIAGRSYKVSFDITVTSGTFSIQLKGSGSDTGNVISTTTTNYTETIIPNFNRTTFNVRSNDGNGVGTVDNIVLQELKHQATNLLVNSGDYQSANPLITSTKSMEFDGVDDYLQLSEPFSYTNHTITGWFKTDDNTTTQEIFSAADSSNVGARVFFASNSKLKYRVGDGTSSTIQSSSTLEANRWYNFACTYDGTTQIMYIDGVNVVSSTPSKTISTTTDVKIGLVSWSNTSYFNGKITEVGAYNRALTALEVASLYNQGVPTDLLVNRNNYQSGNPTVFNTKQIDFDGTDDYLKVENAYGTFTGSISFWYKRDDTTGVQYLFDARGDAGSGTGYALFNSAETVSIPSGTRYVNGVAGNIAMPSGEWHHLVITGISLVINEDIKFGTRYNVESNLDGNISQIGLWNSTLTADEVSSLYNHGLPIDLTTNQAAYASSSNLVGYWRMGSGTLDTYPLIADQTNATLGSNLVVNGTFETPVDNNQWFNFGSPTTAERSTTHAYEGTYSYHIVGDSTNDGTQAAATQFVGDYTVGDVVKITAYVYPITAYSDELKTGVAGSSRSITSSYDVVLNEWNKIEYYVTITNTTVNYITFLIAGTAGEFYLDNVSAEIVQGNPAIMTLMPSAAIENGSPYAELVNNGTFDIDSDWTKGTGVTISNGVATSDGTSGNYDNILVGTISGTWNTSLYYVVSVEVKSYTSGNFKLNQSTHNITDAISSAGTHTVIWQPSNANSVIGVQNSGTPFNGTIDNISVKEQNTGLQGYWKMGDGTNDEYPVIYDQTNPTLGSELVTDGNFATEDDWQFNNTGFSAGAITFDANTDWIFQGISFTVGKTYKIVITKTGVGTPRYRTGYAGTDASTKEVQESGTAYFTATSNTNRIQFYGDANSIDYVLNSVSVVEVQGNPAYMIAMPEGNITNQYPLTKIRNYYRMGDGTLDSKFTSYPATAAPFVFQDQTSPNLAHIPTTNIFEYSEDFSQSYWTKISSSIGVNEIIAPDGTLTADKLKSGLGESEHKVRTSISASTNECISVFAKKGEYKYLFYRLNISGVWSNTFFDLELGTVVSTQNTKSAQIINFGNGWYRCIVSISNRTDALVQIGVSSDGNHVSTGDGTSGIYIWGAQIEQQSQATAYIKSDGIAAVRKSSTTNLVDYSEDFSDWTKTGTTTISATNLTSPIGTTNATRITGLTGSGSNDLRFTQGSDPASKTFTLSVYLKGSGTLRLQLSNNVDNAGSTIITLTSDWVRYSHTHTFNSTSGSLAITLDDSGATATTFDVWGAQLEEQTQAETYAPTKGIPVTIDLFKENNYGTTQGGVIQKDVPRNL